MIPAQRLVPVLLVGSLTLFATWCGFPIAPRLEAQEPKPKVRDDVGAIVTETEIVTRAAVCKWAAKAPVLDGKLDDRCWQRAAVIDRFGSFWTDPKKPRPGTFAYLVWDDDALYYAASMTDTELRSFGTKRNDHLWNGDVFELFLKPSEERPEYYEFQANPRGVVFEAPFPKRGHDFGGFSSAPVLGSKAVVVLKGTLDQPGDRDDGWSVEGRIPWTAFAPSGGKPKPGAEWLFAICRYDYGPKGTDPITMSSAPLTQPSFHRYEDYGKLRFEGPRDETRPPRNR
jgi:cellulose/xylan binding protein with CBM9 domain